MQILVLPVISGLSLATLGCSAMTEREVDQRRYERADYEGVFLDYRASWMNRGKRIWISARGTVCRDGIPGRGDRYYRD